MIFFRVLQDPVWSPTYNTYVCRNNIFRKELVTTESATQSPTGRRHRSPTQSPTQVAENSLQHVTDSAVVCWSCFLILSSYDRTDSKSLKYEILCEWVWECCACPSKSSRSAKTTSDEHLLIILCKQTIWGAFRVIQGPVGRANNMVPLVCYNHYYLQYLVYEEARNMQWREYYVLRKLH